MRVRTFIAVLVSSVALGMAGLAALRGWLPYSFRYEPELVFSEVIRTRMDLLGASYFTCHRKRFRFLPGPEYETTYFDQSGSVILLVPKHPIDARSGTTGAFGMSGGGDNLVPFYADVKERVETFLSEQSFSRSSTTVVREEQNFRVTSYGWIGSYDSSPPFTVDIEVTHNTGYPGLHPGIEAELSWSDFGDPGNIPKYEAFEAALRRVWNECVESHAEHFRERGLDPKEFLRP